MTDHAAAAAAAAMTRVVLLNDLVVLSMGLMGVAWLLLLLLLEAIEHGHGLPPWSPIEPGVVALLVVLTVHASSVLALNVRFGGSGGVGSKMAQEGVQKEAVSNRVVRAAVLRRERVRDRERLQQMSVTICHLEAATG